MKIRIPPVNESPDDADVHFLDDRINQYNFETTGITDGRIFSFFVRDELGDIIAGLYGWTWGGTCAVRYLWVRADHRKRGYGTALMEAVEREALVRGCTQIVLSTHSLQAPRLDERLGVDPGSRLDGWLSCKVGRGGASASVGRAATSAT